MPGVFRARWRAATACVCGLTVAAAVTSAAVRAQAAPSQAVQSSTAPSIDAQPAKAPAPQTAAGPVPAVSPLATQVAKLGDFDYDARTRAAQAVRRAPADQAAPALVAAVTTSLDSYVRFKAFVLLTGLLDPRLEDFARAALTDKNDRLRQAAFDWLERHPVPALAPRLIQLLETEQAEFVRPSLMRALAALDADPTVRTALVRETARGLDIFRGAVIEALGVRRAAFAADAIAKVVAVDGPLRDVAAMALGRIGGAQAASTLAAVHDKDPGVELTLRAAQCLAEEQCDAVRDDIVRQWPTSAAKGTAGAAAGALAVMGERGDDRALALLAEAGIAGVRDLRDHAAVALATVALRAPDVVLAWMASHPDQRGGVLALLKDGFDLMEEDVAEEAFYASVRASYWKAADGSPVRASAAALIDGLDF